jgi:hypothetical protein
MAKPERCFIRLPDGVSVPISVAARRFGLPVSTIRSRLRAGLTGEDLLRPRSIKPTDTGNDD